MGEDAPDTFGNIWEFECKVRHYLNNEEERKERAKKVRERVLSLGSYEDRLKIILGDN